MDALFKGFVSLSLFFVFRAVSVFRRSDNVETSQSSTSQSPSVLPEGSIALHTYEPRQTLTEPPIPEQLKIMIRTLVLDIAGNLGKKELVAGLRGDDARCMVNYLDQLLSSESALNDRQKKQLFDLLSTTARSAQIFPVACELRGVVCNFTRPYMRGVLSCIYKGSYEGQQVCVKAISGCKRRDMAQDLIIQAQAKELMLWSRLSHPNILPFQGVFLSAEEFPRICLASRWIENGDLGRFLKQFPESPKLPFILEITAGIQYLHEYGVVHGDLRAKNILVSTEKRAVIADIGFSNVARTVAAINQEGIGNAVKWMAPELLCGDRPGTTESDVWSLGCLFYEILTGNVPFAELDRHQLVTALARDHITPLSDTAKKGGGLQDIRFFLTHTILQECWKKDPQQRPTAKKICRTIVRDGSVDDYQTTDYLPRPLVDTKRPDAKIYDQRLYFVLSKIMGPPEENTGEHTKDSTSGSENDPHRTSAAQHMNETMSTLGASSPVFDEIPVSDYNKISSSSVKEAVFSSAQEWDTSSSVTHDLATHGAKTSSNPVPNEYKSDQPTSAWENLAPVDNLIDLTGYVRCEPSHFPAHRGGYSDIYIGSLGNKKVSIKVLRISDEETKIDTLMKYLYREAVVWNKLRHENVLSFLGIANGLGFSKNCPALIAPYCANGTARNYITYSTVETRIQIILGVARGLQYLHREDIVHGDLKPSNVLIGDSGQPLLCDFGRSKILGLHGFTTKVAAGTVRYQALELLDGSASPNKSTDVCAFGLTAFEFWTGLIPYPNIHNDNAVISHIIIHRTQQRLPDPVPPMADTLWPILELCMRHESYDRPDIAAVTLKLEFLSSSL